MRAPRLPPDRFVRRAGIPLGLGQVELWQDRAVGDEPCGKFCSFTKQRAYTIV